MFLSIELCLTAICVALAYIHPELADSWFSQLERLFSTSAHRRTFAVVFVGLLALGLRLALLPILPIPQPEIHDEYSHLLLADTLAHGRLANPTHPMWVHFETFHVNWHPTYASMYYPGYALFLALGQVLLGHPFWGVWLSSGLMCAAICWALQGWMPPGWALLGGLLAVIRLGTFSYWVGSYWGGTVTALGGALVLGALPRIKQNYRARDAVLMAIGMALLASTRPYEGLFFCLPVIAALVWWASRKDSPPFQTSVLRVLLPMGCVMAIAFAGLGYYFWRVTGSPLTIPYQLNIRSYGLIYFPWERIKPVAEFHHEVMHEMYRGHVVLGLYYVARHSPLRLQSLKILVIWLFYFGVIFTMPFAAWIYSRPPGRIWKSFGPESRFLLLLSLATYLSIMLTIYVGQPHYAAPLAATFYAMILLVMRDLWSWKPQGRPSGRFLVRSVPVICLVVFLARSAAPLIHATPRASWIRTWCSEDSQNLKRAAMLKQLENSPGNQVVIVRYKPDHDFILDEWVFNLADIDNSKVLWARDMGPQQNRELLRYFSDRHFWIVEPDTKPVTLTVYDEGSN